MAWLEVLRSNVKAGRKRGSIWVRVLDRARLVRNAEGRARLWTSLVHGGQIHQTTPHTAEDRYPALFDMAANLAPDSKRILSFGCSTGEELMSIRRRFSKAQIVGVEINPRSRRLARKRVTSDSLTIVIGPNDLNGSFDLIFALAVLQREPHKVAEMELNDLGRDYPFERFDAAVGDLVERLCPSGLLCVINAHYPVELSAAASQLDPVSTSPEMTPPLFGRDSHLLGPTVARTIFRKRA
jgi:hypothetical protein